MPKSLKVRSSKKNFVESKIRSQYPGKDLEVIAKIELGIGRSTLISFKDGKPVQTDYFHQICNHFKIDWQEVVARFHPVKLPRPGAELFVGRSQEIQDLHSLISQESSVAITQVSGMGGVGKSELIRQYAHSQINEETTAFPGGILYINARSSEEQIEQDIINFVEEVLEISVPLKPQRGSKVYATVDRVAWCFRNWEPEGDVLLILDDVTDFETISPLREIISARFKVVITTRLKNLGAGFKRLEINVLKPDASLKLLLGLSERAVATLDEVDFEKAKKVCAWLGHLPLAVELVGRYLSIHEGLTFNEMLNRLEEKRIQQRALMETHPGMTNNRSLWAAFELSWSDLDENSKLIAYIIATLGHAPVEWFHVYKAVRDVYLNYRNIEIDEEIVQESRDAGLVNRHLLKFDDLVIIDLSVNVIKSAYTFELYKVHELTREYFIFKLFELSFSFRECLFIYSISQLAVRVKTYNVYQNSLTPFKFSAIFSSHVDEALAVYSLRSSKLRDSSPYALFYLYMYKGSVSLYENEPIDAYHYYLSASEILSSDYPKDTDENIAIYQYEVLKNSNCLAACLWQLKKYREGIDLLTITILNVDKILNKYSYTFFHKSSLECSLFGTSRKKSDFLKHLSTTCRLLRQACVQLQEYETAIFYIDIALDIGKNCSHDSAQYLAIWEAALLFEKLLLLTKLSNQNPTNLKSLLVRVLDLYENSISYFDEMLAASYGFNHLINEMKPFLLENRGLLGRLENILSHMLDVERERGKISEGFINSIYALGDVYDISDKYAEAEKLYTEGIEVVRSFPQQVGLKRRLAILLMRIAKDYIKLGKLKEAENCYLEVLGIYVDDEALHKDCFIFDVAANVFLAYNEQKKYQDMEEFVKKVLALIYNKKGYFVLLYENSPKTLIRWIVFHFNALYYQNKLNKSIDIIPILLTLDRDLIYSRNAELDFEQVYNALISVSKLYVNSGLYTMAEEVYTEILEVIKKYRLQHLAAFKIQEDYKYLMSEIKTLSIEDDL